MQPFFPLEDELVKVPKGHGKREAIVSFLATSLKPEAKRTEINLLPRIPSGVSTSIGFSSKS